MKSFVKYHLPAILYAVAILVIPSIAGFRTHTIRFLLTDKLAHFLEYAVFALLTYRSLTHLHQRIGERMVFLLSLLCLAVFGVVDEVIQSFIPGRRADAWDYAADLAGGLLVLILLAAFQWFRPVRT
jgi:VanZ family protein